MPDDEDSMYIMRLSRIPWEPAKQSFDQSDYIMSILVDTPYAYMILPNQQMALAYIHPKGIIRIVHDFSGLSEEQQSMFIHYVRRDLG
jgi:hypothetical protein